MSSVTSDSLVSGDHLNSPESATNFNNMASYLDPSGSALAEPDLPFVGFCIASTLYTHTQKYFIEYNTKKCINRFVQAAVKQQWSVYNKKPKAPQL